MQFDCQLERGAIQSNVFCFKEQGTCIQPGFPEGQRPLGTLIWAKCNPTPLEIVSRCWVGAKEIGITPQSGQSVAIFFGSCST